MGLEGSVEFFLLIQEPLSLWSAGASGPGLKAHPAPWALLRARNTLRNSPSLGQRCVLQHWPKAFGMAWPRDIRPVLHVS